MLELCCNKTHGAMKNHDGRDDNVNKYKNDDDNADSISGSDYNAWVMPWSRGGGSGDDNDGAAATAPYVSTLWNISTL